ncbi:MAG TPA: hypothetical protein VFR58_14765 [Flavisolibacter sp.]|nr:hypothetical protein [Flavisolibacter sp.]
MKAILYLASALLGLAGCSTLKMSVSDELKAANDEYVVKGRQGILVNQKLSFGDYRTTKVKRSWTKGGNGRTGIGLGGTTQQDWVNIISVEYIKRKQTVNFSLSDGQLNSDVYCVSRFNAEDLQIGKKENSLLNIGLDLFGKGGSSESSYYVQIFTGNDAEPWQLLLDNQASQSRSRTYTGYLVKGRDEYYTIHPVTKLDHKGKTGNTLMGSVGFEIRDREGRALAAVSLIDKGMVFLGKTDPAQRFLMANVCSAILLQEQIGG